MWSSNCSASSLLAIDATFTKYLKRYLQVPQHSNNNIVYFLTSTNSLSSKLKTMSPQVTGALNFPEELHGHQLTFLSSPPDNNPSVIDISGIPSWFWMSRIFKNLPTGSKARRNLCREILDSDHYTLCHNTTFHVSPSLDCKCIHCGQNAHYYHERFCMLN